MAVVLEKLKEVNNHYLPEESYETNDGTLVLKYSPLVKKILFQLIYRVPDGIQIDDLLQTGMMGLIEAAKNYDVKKGASFSTYASIRIRGMILDELRKLDWTPRSVNKHNREIAKAIHHIEGEKGRDARNQEVAEELKISLDEYHIMQQEMKMMHWVGLDDIGIDDDCLSCGYGASIPGPTEYIEQEDMLNSIKKAMRYLPEREQLVLSLYYEEDLNLKQIGQILDVSESRVCQLHNHAIDHLRSELCH